VEWIQAFLDSRPAVDALCGRGSWVGIGGGAAIAAGRARRAKRISRPERERQWQGHRREGGSVTPLRKK